MYHNKSDSANQLNNLNIVYFCAQCQSTHDFNSNTWF